MRYTVDMVSDSMIYIQNFMMIGTNIQVEIRLLPPQLERL
jgi:hypothetical protein